VTAPSGHRPGPPHRPVNWSALGYSPGPNTPLLACRCGGKYLNDEPGWAAHLTVFGHSPRTPEPDPTEGDRP
jgi:hypothetical protein